MIEKCLMYRSIIIIIIRKWCVVVILMWYSLKRLRAELVIIIQLIRRCWLSATATPDILWIFNPTSIIEILIIIKRENIAVILLLLQLLLRLL